VTEIVKVQKALASNDPTLMDVALIYAKGRRCMVQQRLDFAANTAMGDDVKAFFEGDFRPSVGSWKIGKRVADRDW
jgi:hypothetical protein